MPEMEVIPRFISVGCNRTPETADWSRESGRVAFGAGNCVALWEPVPEVIVLADFRGGRWGYMVP